MSVGSVSMLPVIIGGFLAIIGGLSSQLIVHWLSDRREQAKIRRDRIEALVRSVYAHSQWVTDRHRFMVFRGEDYDKPDPWAMTLELMRFKWGRIFALPSNRHF